MKSLLKVLFAFSLFACASAPWQQVQPASKIFQLNGFSVDLGEVEGWYVNSQTSATRLMLAKRNNTSDPYENYAIEADVVAAPLFKADGEFLAAVKNGKAISKDARYKILHDDIKMYKKQTENCALSQTVAEDDGNIPSFGLGTHRMPGAMLFEVVTLTCRETGNPKNILDLSFSLRYYPKQRDPLFTEKAMKIVDCVTIK